MRQISTIVVLAAGLTAGPVAGQSAAPPAAQSIPNEPTPQAITSESAMEERSPDGRSLMSEEPTGTPNVRRLAVRDVETGEMRYLTTPPRLPRGRIWSRDSRQIAYESCEPPSSTGTRAVVLAQTACELRVVNRDGSGDRAILAASPGRRELMDWSPDARQVLVIWFDRPQKSMLQLGLVAIADGSIRVLATEAMETSSLGGLAELSPDGRYVVYSAYKDFYFAPYDPGRKDDIFILPVDGSDARLLIEGPADDSFLGWTPAGAVLFTSDRAGTVDLWMARVVDGRVDGLPLRLLRGIGRVESFGVAPDGTLRYSKSGLKSSEVYVATVDAATGAVVDPPRPVTSSHQGRNSEPIWSPDGQMLIYRSGSNAVIDRSGGQSGFDTLTFLSTDTGAERLLRVQVPGTISNYGMTTDEKTAVITAAAGSFARKHDLYRIDVATGATEMLGDAARESVVLPDGRAVIYAQGRRVLMRNLKGGEPRVIYQVPGEGGGDEGIAGLSVSPDGRHVAFRVELTTGTRPTKTTTHSLWVVAFADPAGREIASLRSVAPRAEYRATYRTTAWSPDGKHVYFVEPEDAEATTTALWRVPVAGGAPQRLLVADGHILSPSLHPNGRHLAFSVSRAEKGTFALQIPEGRGGSR